MKNSELCKAIATVAICLGLSATLSAQQTPSAVDPWQAQVLYTGRMMGYFRIPSVQPRDGSQGCDTRNEWSYAAQQFDAFRQQNSGAILLGAGDNFAPETEARQFAPSNPAGPSSPPGQFVPLGKDQYVWYPGTLGTIRLGNRTIAPNSWVSMDDASRMPGFSDFLRRGQGFLPTDNVACFLSKENYTAVVPGKHDFYFGSERLREMARFLASTPRPDGHHVQMLGSNLVIDTTWRKNHKPLSDSEHKWKFSPSWPVNFASSGLPVPQLVTPGTGAKVYPWLPGAAVKLMDLNSVSMLYRDLYGQDLLTDGTLDSHLQQLALPDSACEKDRDCRTDLAKLSSVVNAFTKDNDPVYLCKSTANGNPDEIALPPSSHCSKTPLDRIVWLENDSVEYLLLFPEPLKANENYALCLTGKNLPPIENGRRASYYCQRFSVYWPLFMFPSRTLSPSDPQPYAFVKGDASKQQPDVGVFGVVDPDLAGYVGALNLQWENKDQNGKDTPYKTTTAIEDPKEALKESNLSFEWMYEQRSGVKRFEGMKILLAQMSPPRAQALAKRIGGFDMVVSAADENQASAVEGTTLKFDWTSARSSPPDHPAFSLVPEPYYVGTREPKEQVSIGSVQVAAELGPSWKWHFEASTFESPVPADASPPPKFWQAVAVSAASACSTFGTVPLATADPAMQIQLLTLCAMQKELGADVVLLQERDFFTHLPKDAGDMGTTPGSLQQILDRIIWKGDFLTLLYVPGSALVQAMEQSKKYKAEDESALSLADENLRDLVSLGIRYDSGRGEYLINGDPLDTTRVYAVATSDYISAGDTGYPDLAAAAMNPRKDARDFPAHLDMISAVVCRRMAADNSSIECQPKINRENYLDALDVEPSDSRKGQTPGQQLWAWTIFHRSYKVPAAKAGRTADEQAEQSVERRGLGSLRINPPSPTLLAVDKASFSVTSVSHKFTDGQLKTLFPGSPVTQLTTARSHSFAFDIRPKYAYSWDQLELFQAQEIRYNVQYTGQANASAIINQVENLWSTDTGVALHVEHRELPHVEPTFSFHTETQLWNPLPSFLESLASSGKPQVAQPFNLGRTYLLLPRAGLRWAGRANWAEAGLEDGAELSAIRLLTAPTPPPGTGTETIVQRPNITVNGVYWNGHTVVPLYSNLTWQIDEDGDYFFNTHGDNPIDTRFRSDSETALNFKVWPSLSFAPTYEFFVYSNKVQGIWFWQGQASLKMNVRVDFWNHRQWSKVLKNTPSKSQ